MDVHALTAILPSGVLLENISFKMEDDVGDLKKQILSKIDDNAAVRNLRIISAGKELKPDTSKLNSYTSLLSENCKVHAVFSRVVVEVIEPTQTPPKTTKKSTNATNINSEIFDLTSSTETTIRRASKRSAVVDLTSISEPTVTMASTDYGIVNLVDEDSSNSSYNSTSRSKRTKRNKSSDPLPIDAIPIPDNTGTSTEKRLKKYVSSCSASVSSRMDRALSQRLYLLDQKQVSETERTFSVLGSTGNVYDVSISRISSCTCPDFLKGNHLCKHILFVLTKALHIARTSPHVYQRALLGDELREIFRAADRHQTVAIKAKSDVVKAFRKAKGLDVEVDVIGAVALGDGHEGEEGEDNDAEAECPICFEQMEASTAALKEAIEKCTTCKIRVHKDCMQRWLRQASGPTCPQCRSVWPTGTASTSSSSSSAAVASREGYLNLGNMQGMRMTRDTSTYHSYDRRYGRSGRGYGDGDEGDY